MGLSRGAERCFECRSPAVVVFEFACSMQPPDFQGIYFTFLSIRGPASVKYYPDATGSRRVTRNCAGPYCYGYIDFSLTSSLFLLLPFPLSFYHLLIPLKSKSPFYISAIHFPESRNLFY